MIAGRTKPSAIPSWGEAAILIDIHWKCESGEKLQLSSTSNFCENLSTTGDIDVSVGNNNVLIISQCLGWWHRDNYQDTNRNINVVKTFMAAMTLPMTLLIVRTNPRKVSPNSRKEQRWQWQRWKLKTHLVSKDANCSGTAHLVWGEPGGSQLEISSNVKSCLWDASLPSHRCTDGRQPL